MGGSIAMQRKEHFGSAEPVEALFDAVGRRRGHGSGWGSDEAVATLPSGKANLVNAGAVPIGKPNSCRFHSFRQGFETDVVKALTVPCVHHVRVVGPDDNLASGMGCIDQPFQIVGVLVLVATIGVVLLSKREPR